MEVLRKVKFNGGGATHRLNKGFSAFTLAEMMVVMLIMSIVLAAMAPIMTTKNKVDNSSPWKYSPNNSSDAYFGQGASMRAMIGQLNGEDTDNGKLIINNLGSSFSHILFKNGNTILGDLYMSGNNLILGHRNGSSTSLGQNNINIGPNNWPSTDITGQSNIIIGDNAMTHLSTGSNNIGLGTTLTALTTGTGNVTIGDNSLTSVTTGDGNIGLGNEANPAITTASKTIAIGTNSVASSNGAIAIGSNLTSSEAHGAALDAAQARVSYSIAIGNNATSGANSGGGQNSIAIGYQAKANSTSDSGTSGIAIGAYSNAGDHSVALGTSALNSNTTGSDNIAVGTSALKSNTTGSGNTAIGENTLYSNTRGDDNIAIGKNALYQSDTGGGNIAIGYQAMYYQNDINTGNTAVGYQAMVGTNSASNYHNTAIGYRALSRAGNSAESAGQNTAVGSGALENNVTGFANTAIGSDALNTVRQGDYNTGLGNYACANVTGSHKTCIGASSGPASGSDWASDDKERIFIGSRSKFNNGPAVLEVHNEGGSSFGRNKDSSVVINGNLIVKGGIITTLWRYGGGDNDNVNLLARSSRQLEPEWNDTVSELFKRYADNGHGEFKSFSGNVISDRRLKYVGKESTTGLDKVRQLKVFNFTYKKDTTKTPHVGVIAQDLQKVFPNAVQKGKDGFLTIRMEDMFYAVINAIKELDAKITALQKENQELKQLVKQVQEDNKRLDQRLQKLEAKQK